MRAKSVSIGYVTRSEGAAAFVARWVKMLRGCQLLMCAEGPWFGARRGTEVKLLHVAEEMGLSTMVGIYMPSKERLVDQDSKVRFGRERWCLLEFA